ncbi:glycosyltransferase [Portibacter marinus]|uniref:glycosyltransferase n=1 Tax=Portibacter marinus TaxID=2898660 RepID=UPI001F2E1F27|nr:glycosyltransferase [Portibacter marinus]
MKILIIYRIYIDEKSTFGIARKQKSQASAFRALGHECDFLAISAKGYCLNDKLIKRKNFGSEPAKSFNLFYCFFRDIPKILKKTYGVYYIRYSPMSSGLEMMVERLSRHFPESKVILDFPTFPFIEEYTGLKKKIASYRFKKVSDFSRRIDKATVLDDRKTIIGIPCIQIENAIDVEKLKPKTINTDHKIDLLFVGHLTKSQGIDRLINGFIEAEEAMREKFTLTIIGEGPEENRLKAMASPFEDYIRFMSNKYNQELDSYYNQADLGIGNLGIHRVGLDYSSGLKHREYCARGLPFFYSCKDSKFDDENFIIKVDPDDSSIDLKEISDQYAMVEKNVSTIRKFAEKNIGWKKEMQKILDHL